MRNNSAMKAKEQTKWILLRSESPHHSTASISLVGDVVGRALNPLDK